MGRAASPQHNTPETLSPPIQNESQITQDEATEEQKDTDNVIVPDPTTRPITVPEHTPTGTVQKSHENVHPTEQVAIHDTTTETSHALPTETVQPSPQNSTKTKEPPSLTHRDHIPTLDQENTFNILQHQVREIAHELNEELDDDDNNNDSIFAEDLVLAARRLLEEGKTTCNFSARKLQHWITEIESHYKPQFENLRPSEELTEAFKEFELLIENAYEVQAAWQDEETQNRLKSETQAMRQIITRRSKHRSEQEAQRLTRLLKSKLHLKTPQRGTETDSDSNSSDTDSDKENIPPSPTNNAEASTSVLYKLTKSARNIGLYRLKASPDLRERRKLFNSWQSDLAIVTSTVSYTQDLFANWPQKINAIPPFVDAALFMFITSKCEAGPKAHIRNLQGHGTKAITELQRHYAQITPEIIDSAMRRYQQLRQRTTETATSYIQRFDSTLDECRQLGENFESHQVLSRFMDGLYTQSPVYQARIESLLAHKNMSAQNTSIQPITLSYVQSQLLSIDEKRGLTTPTNAITRYKGETPYAMKAYANFKNYKRPPPQRQDQKTPVQCGYKYCRKPGHTTAECRKRKRDEERTKSTSTHPSPRQYKQQGKSQEPRRCHKCNEIGHFANACPHKSTPHQSAHRASVDKRISRTTSTLPRNKKNHIDEIIMMAVTDTPTPWNTRPHRPPFVRITAFKDFLPDSGATSHFTGHLADLDDPQPCNVEVTVADGNKVRATHVGQADIHFTTDHGSPSTLQLAHLYYIPGLSRRLFSLQAFTRDTPFSVEITHHYTRLNFGDGEVFTWPVSRNENNTDRYAFSATHDKTHTSNAQKSDSLTTRPIPLEKGIIRLGFRAAKGLLAGSLHRVWEDCHIQATADPYCWSARLAISRVAPRNLRRPVYYPKKSFEMVFVDIIPNPHKETLTLNTAYDGHLLIVCPFSNYTYWRGLTTFTSATIIQAIETFRTHTTSKGTTVSLQYIRADAASYFTSQEFINWGNTNNTKISIAAPHHQEMNSIVERQWQNMSKSYELYWFTLVFQTISTTMLANMQPASSTFFQPKIYWITMETLALHTLRLFVSNPKSAISVFSDVPPLSNDTTPLRDAPKHNKHHEAYS
jgi:hypothetical protein